MGKNRDAARQRTKGNLQPSSSSKAAEFLSKGSTFSPPSTNSGGVSTGGGALGPVLGLALDSSAGAAEEAIPPNIRQAMKKMSKKDAVTKHKALQEFSELLQEESCSEDDVKSLLPFWPRIFSKLTSDNDKRVREATHKAHLKVVMKAGRGLAPQLKALSGPWFLSLSDPHPPAASMALKAFQEAFPKNKDGRNKFEEAVIFCQTEICSLIRENLLALSLQTMGSSDGSKTEFDDLESKYYRTIQASLAAYGSILDITLGARLAPEALALHTEILDSGKFWKLAQSKNSAVKGSWFNLTGILAKSMGKFEAMSSRHKEKLASAVFNQLDDWSDPVLSTRVWDAMVYFTAQPGWEEHVSDMDKKVLSKVLPLLEGKALRGGLPVNPIMFAYFLPFLSGYPDHSEDFYRQFFSSFATGINSVLSQERPKSVAGKGGGQLRTSSDADRACASFFECALYALTKHPEQASVVCELVNQTVAEKVFQKTAADSDGVIVSTVKCHTSFLKAYARFISSTKEKDEAALPAAVRSCVDKLWQYFVHTCNRLGQISSPGGVASVDNQQLLREEALETLQTLIIAFKAGSVERAQPKRRLGFASDSEQQTTSSDTTSGMAFSEHEDLNAVVRRVASSTVVSVITSCSTVVSDSSEETSEHLTKQLHFLRDIFRQRHQKEFYDEIVKDLASKEESLACLESSEASSVALFRALCRKVVNYQSVLAPYTDLCLAFTASTKPEEIADPLMSELKALYFDQSQHQIVSVFLKKLTSLKHRAILMLSLNPLRKEEMFLSQLFCTLVDTLTVILLSDDESSETNFGILLTLLESVGPMLPGGDLQKLMNALSVCYTDESIKDSALSQISQSLSAKVEQIEESVRSVPGVKLFSSVFWRSCQQETPQHCFVNLWASLLKVLCRTESSQAGAKFVELVTQELTCHRATKSFIQQFCLALSYFEGSLSKKQILVEIMDKGKISDSALRRIHLLDVREADFVCLDLEALLTSGRRQVMSFNHAQFFVDVMWTLACSGEDDFEYPAIKDHVTDIFDIQICGRDYPLEYIDNLVDSVAALQFLLRSKPHLANFIESEEVADRDDIGKTLTRVEEILNVASPASAIAAVQSSFDNSLEEGYEYGYAFEWMLDTARTDGRKLKIPTDEMTVQAKAHVQCTRSRHRSVHSLRCLEKGASSGARNMAFEIEACEVTSLISKMLSGSREEGGEWVALTKLASLVNRAPPSVDIAHNLLQSLIGWKTEKPEDFVMDPIVADATGSALSRMVVFCQTFTYAFNLLMKNAHERPDTPLKISGEEWDLVSVSATTWMNGLLDSDLLQACHKTSREETDSTYKTKVWYLAKNVLSMVTELSSRMRDLGTSLPDRRSKDLVEEWNEFFVDGIFGEVLSKTLELCVDASNPPKVGNKVGQLEAYVADSLHGTSVLTSLGQLVKLLPETHLTEHSLPAKFLPQDVDATVLPDKIVFLLNHFCPIITGPSKQAGSIAFQLLMRVMEMIAHYESSREDTLQDDYTSGGGVEGGGEDEEMAGILKLKVLPRRLAEILAKTEPLIQAFLEEFRFDFGEELPSFDTSGSAPASTASVANIFKSYLMTWRLVLEIVAKANDAIRMKYSDCFRDNIGLLVRVLFHLLPQRRLVSGDTSTERLGLPDLASSCLYCLMRYLPALVRSHWGQMDRKNDAAIIDRFTASCVTPVLWQEEVTRINSKRKEDRMDNMTVKVRSNVREVVASYNFNDEGSMEVVIQLPTNFPLGSVQVESTKKVGVTHTQWRNMMLQLTTFLQHQNGSIVEGLSVWKRNIDKRFEGVEECYICFFVLHGTNHQLPKATCRTCKKKFHGACLYKWFQTSNNSTCPLCRNLF